MSTEKLAMLSPKGVDMFSVGRSTIRGMTPHDISACMVDCSDLQEIILLTASDCLQPNEEQLKHLHIRVGRIMNKRKWEVSKKDSKRKSLLLLTRLCFHLYCSNQTLTDSDKARAMNVSRSQWYKVWLNRFNVVMDDFDDYLRLNETEGLRLFWRKAWDLNLFIE